MPRGGCTDARTRLERALGRWVVHETVPVAVPYDPADAEYAVVARASASARSTVYEAFRESIRAHAEVQKEKLKVELDARRAALAGILNEKHAKAVNNQKSAHLSKFLAVQVTEATDQLVQWLVAQRYS